MAAAYRDSIKVVASGSTITVTPASDDGGLTYSSGDVLVLAVFGYTSISAPSGSDLTWTERLSDTQAGPFGNTDIVKVYTAVADASISSFTLGMGISDQYGFCLMSVSGADTASPIDGTALITSNTFNVTADPTAPSLTDLTGSDSLMIVGAGVWLSSDKTSSMTPPSGMTEREDWGDWDHYSVATLALASNAATGTKAFAESPPTSSSNEAWIAFSIAIKSAGASATNANAENAAITISSQTAQVAVGVNADPANTTVASQDPNPKVDAPIESVAITMSAQDATVSTAVMTNADAQVASVGFDAQDTTSTIQTNAEAATAVTGANDGQISVAVPAGLASFTVESLFDAGSSVFVDVVFTDPLDWTISALDAVTYIAPVSEAASFTFGAQDATVSTSGGAGEPTNANAEAVAIAFGAQDATVAVAVQAAASPALIYFMSRQYFLSEFTGTDGDNWSSSEWGSVSNRGAYVRDIQSNRGRIILNHTSGGSTAPFVRTTLIGDTTLVDSEISGMIQWVTPISADGPVAFFALRSDGLYNSTVGSGGVGASNGRCNGYLAVMSRTSQVIQVLSGATGTSGPLPTTLGTVTQTITDDTWYRFRFQASGNIIRFKMWQDGSGEPDWQIVVTDTTHTGANLTYPLCLTKGNTSGSQQVFLFDDVQVTDTDRNPIISIQTQESGSAITFGANDVTASIATTAEAVVIAFGALDASVTAGTVVNAELASMTVAANDVDKAVSPGPTEATIAATANDPSPSILVTAEQIVLAAQAQDATATFIVQALAGLASITWDANDPSASIQAAVEAALIELLANGAITLGAISRIELIASYIQMITANASWVERIAKAASQVSPITKDASYHE